MNSNPASIIKALALAAAGLFAGVLTAPAAGAHDVYLVAKEFVKTMPDGAPIHMWGFAEDLDGDLGTDGGETPTVPGPPISVPIGEGVLNIHVRNDLDVPMSIVIPAQAAALSPVKFMDGQGRMRARAFTHETAPGGGIGLYSWTSFAPGSYIYHSGSHPAVQVQMGLYGAVTQDATGGEAYPGKSYDNEVLLFYSEIDPALHDAVFNGVYGTEDYPSTVNYRPKYFLINGEPYYPGRLPVPAGTAGDDVLVRFFNAGLDHHVPLLPMGRLRVIAEDGQPYTYEKDEYSVFLPAGKTVDALLVLGAPGDHPVVDRRLYLTDNEVSGGGMLIYLSAAP